MAFFSFNTPSGRGANAVLSDSVFNTFCALVDSKAAAHTTYTPPDGVRGYGSATPWCLELEGALRLWLSTRTSETAAAFTAIGTSISNPDYNLTKKSGPGDREDTAWERVFVSAAFPQVRGGGSGLHPAVFLQFLITTDNRAVLKTGGFSSDLAAAMAAWS